MAARALAFGLAALGLTVGGTGPALSHPHVFVDGGVDFVFRDGAVLQEVRVTWLYDAFETLYILSSHGLSLDAQGELDEQDRQELVRLRSQWPSDFDGSAHLTMGGKPVTLAPPEGLDAHIIDGRLQLTFARRLEAPLDLSQVVLDVGFYESTYFFSFKITNTPELLGDASACSSEVAHFVADAQDSALQDMLARLSREETPADIKVGAMFADRITVRCE